MISAAALQTLREGLPTELWSCPRFLLFRLRRRSNGRIGKVPATITHNGLRDSSPHIRPAWLPLEDALSLLAAGHGDGLGLVLQPDAGIVALDLDGVVQQDKVRAEAAELVGQLASYTERSLSGLGLHVLIRGTLPDGGRRCRTLELIDHGFLAMTGDYLPGSRVIQARQAQLAQLHREQFLATRRATRSPDTEQWTSLGSTDDAQVLAMLLAARNGDRVRSLLVAGDVSAYPSRSEADFAAARLIGWATEDPEQVVRIMVASPLCRPERWTRGTYLKVTVARALALGYPQRRRPQRQKGTP